MKRNFYWTFCSWLFSKFSSNQVYMVLLWYLIVVTQWQFKNIIIILFMFVVILLIIWFQCFLKLQSLQYFQKYFIVIYWMKLKYVKIIRNYMIIFKINLKIFLKPLFSDTNLILINVNENCLFQYLIIVQA